MSTRRIWTATALGMVVAMIGVALVATPAAAESADVIISTTSWYWEEAQKQEIKDPQGNTVTVETPSPFCPGPGSGLGNPSNTCAQGRLPIEIRRGDYETPNKLSAVAFDLSLVPVGSEVHSFTATFREAKAGCYETDGKVDQDPRDDQCEETDPVNVGKHQLQACLVNSYFGEGDAREYREVTNYTCSDTDPVAKRKEVKSEKDGPGSDFYWTFDLTSFAKDWVKSFSTNTSIMITGVPLNKDDTETWRVVLAGPKFENGFVGEIKFTPGEIDEIPPPVPPGTPPGTTTTTTGGESFTSGGTSGFDTSGSSGGTGGEIGPGSSSGGGAPAEEAPVLATEGAEDVPQGFPGYVWLAIVAGIVGFSLVRSVVLESASGIRPDGVLATIHRINADRAAPALEGTSAGSFSAGLKTVLGKLNFMKKG